MIVVCFLFLFASSVTCDSSLNLAVSWMNPDGEVETRMAANKIFLSETAVNGSSHGILRVSRGSRMITLVFGEDDMRPIDCEAFRDKASVREFKDQVLADIRRTLLDTQNDAVVTQRIKAKLKANDVPSIRLRKYVGHNGKINVRKMEKECRELPTRMAIRVAEDMLENKQGLYVQDSDFFRSRRSVDSMRMPGTNWCGKGTRTDEYYQLGAYGGADKCCRQHDLGCPVSIQPMEVKYGIYNYRMYTAMHCTCDERFWNCLKMTNSASANLVGKVFFNMIRTPCFVLTTRRTCVEKTWWGKCLKFENKQHAVWREPKPYF